MQLIGDSLNSNSFDSWKKYLKVNFYLESQSFSYPLWPRDSEHTRTEKFGPSVSQFLLELLSNADPCSCTSSSGKIQNTLTSEMPSNSSYLTFFCTDGPILVTVWLQVNVHDCMYTKIFSLFWSCCANSR